MPLCFLIVLGLAACGSEDTDLDPVPEQPEAELFEAPVDEGRQSEMLDEAEAAVLDDTLSAGPGLGR